MSLQLLRHAALPIILIPVFGTSASANWFSDLFSAASHEELPTPQPELSDGPVPVADPRPMLVPPYQSQRWSEEEWPAEGEIVLPNAVQSEMPPLAESEPAPDAWSDIWGDGEASPDAAAFAPPFFDPFLDGTESGSQCCAAPKIRYWNHPLIGIATSGSGGDLMQQVVLELAEECCPIQVPVCIPACCSGAPERETRHGLLGRTTHSYCWPCGHRVKIVRWGQGDLIVHTYNPPGMLPLQCLSDSSGGRVVEL